MRAWQCLCRAFFFLREQQFHFLKKVRIPDQHEVIQVSPDRLIRKASPQTGFPEPGDPLPLYRFEPAKLTNSAVVWHVGTHPALRCSNHSFATALKVWIACSEVCC
jgi:hypothetical protein